MTSSSVRATSLVFSFALCAAVACNDDDGAPDDGGQAGDSSAGAPLGASGAGAESVAGQGGAGGEAGGVSSEFEPVSIRFRATVGDADFACGEVYEGQGTTEATVVPQDLRFFVENVRLIDTEDREVPLQMDERAPFQTKDVALLDFEDGTAACANGNAELNGTITGRVPPGNYVGLAFSTSVPLELNHADPTSLPAPLQAGGMTWGWLFGFRFIKAELGLAPHQTGEGGASGGAGQGHGGQGSSSGEGGAGGDGERAVGGDGHGHGRPESPGGVFHLGSVECENTAEPDPNAPPTTACAKQFRNEIRLTGFDMTESVVVADVGALFSGVDLASGSQCHSFSGADCPALFAAVGLDFETGDSSDEQSFFRIE